MKSALLLISIVGMVFGHEDGSIDEPLAIVGPSSGSGISSTPKENAPHANNYCLAEHNRMKNQNGLPSLTADSRLEASAADHNQVMVSQNCFNHQCPGEPNFADRITRRGYQWSGAAENIAKGYADCNAAVAGWMNSPGHRANILGNYRHIGCAELSKHYTCNFANPR